MYNLPKKYINIHFLSLNYKKIYDKKRLMYKKTISRCVIPSEARNLTKIPHSFVLQNEKVMFIDLSVSSAATAVAPAAAAVMTAATAAAS